MRNYENFLTAFREYCESSEAPDHVLFWVGVSAVAGALQRRCWLSQGKFVWYPNMFIILVAPPGIIAKSTTTGYAMDILRKVPEINFGPSVVTWQALMLKFAKIGQDFMAPTADGKDLQLTQSAMTLFSSELGNLIAPNDREMLDTLTTLFDCSRLSKETLKDGECIIETPCLNLVACTTPEWISANLPAYMIGGGLVSRCIMVKAENKRQLVAYPGTHPHAAVEREMEPRLVEDLTAIAEMRGEFTMTPEAVAWGEQWYKEHYRTASTKFGDSRANGYLARKQTHVHKLAMILSASRRETMQITREDMVDAEYCISTIEPDLPGLFDFMGKTQASNQADRIVDFIRRHPGVSLRETYHHVLKDYPKYTDFDAVMKGLLKSGTIAHAVVGGRMGLVLTESPA